MFTSSSMQLANPLVQQLMSTILLHLGVRQVGVAARSLRSVLPLAVPRCLFPVLGHLF